MLSNAYFLAKFHFDTAENEPAKNLSLECRCTSHTLVATRTPARKLESPPADRVGRCREDARREGRLGPLGGRQAVHRTGVRSLRVDTVDLRV